MIADIVSAPLWDSTKSKFAGLLTSNDFLNVIQYYCQFPDKLKEVDQFRLGSMRGRAPTLSRELAVAFLESNTAAYSLLFRY